MAAIIAAWASYTPVARAQAAGSWPADRHKQVDTVFAPWTGTTTPGCAVAISLEGALDYARGYGMSNLEYDVPITPDSIFHVASIAKHFHDDHTGNNGADAGYRANVIAFPDQRLAIVALCNGSTITPSELTRKVADVYLGDRLAAVVPPTVKAPEAELSVLAGVYWSPVSDQGMAKVRAR